MAKTNGAQSAINGIGGYAAGLMEGSRRRGKRERAMDMEEYKGTLDAHLGYVERYAELQKALNEHTEGLRQKGAEHATDLAMRIQNQLHGLNARNATRQQRFDLERANNDARLSTEGLDHLAGLAKNLRKNGVTSIIHNGSTMHIAPKFKPSSPTVPGVTPPAGLPLEPVKIPDTFKDMHPDELAKWEEHRPSMTPQQKAAHRRETNKHNKPPKAPAPAKPEGLNETIHPDD